MFSPLIRFATGMLPAVALTCAFFLTTILTAAPAEAKERPRGDWHRYCKDVDIRGDWLEADCRKHGGGWRRNTRINFDNCPGNEVTVRDGYLVCERRYGRNDHWNHGGGWGHNGWDNDRWDRDRWDHNDRYGWDRRDNDRRDWDRRDHDRRDWDRNRNGHDWNGRRDNDRHDGNRDWSQHRDNDRRDGNWNGRRDNERQQVVRKDSPRQDWNNGRGDNRQNTQRRDDNNRREADRRDDNRRDDNRRRDNERDEWWKRGNS